MIARFRSFANSDSSFHISRIACSALLLAIIFLVGVSIDSSVRAQTDDEGTLQWSSSWSTWLLAEPPSIVPTEEENFSNLLEVSNSGTVGESTVESISTVDMSDQSATWSFAPIDMPPVTAPETAPSNIENQELSDRIRESLETTGDSSMRSLSARRSTLSTAASDISRDGLEIEYLFEGNLEDTSGNANHLAVSAGISFVTGQFGSAVSMPQDSYVLGYSSSTYDPGVMRTDYTMAFWFRTSNTSAGLFAVTKWRVHPQSVVETDRNIYLSNGNICHFLWQDERICTTGKNYADDRWHFVAIRVQSGVGQAIFVDWASVSAQGNKVQSDFVNADGFVLGYAHVPQNWSYASFDDFRIYSRPLSGVEIEALSLQSPSPRCDDGIRNQGEISVDVGGPCIDRLRTNLVTEYRFDGNSLDTSGSGNHAISNGSTIFVPGVSGQALSMSWGNAGISNSSVAPQLSTDATFSAWVKLPSLDYHAAQTVFAKNWDSTFAFMVATPSASMPTANVWLSLGTASIDTTTSGIDLREWTQISYTVASRGVMKLYINGQLIKTLGVTSVPSIFQRMNSNSLVFWQFGSWWPMTGAVDNIRIYNIELSEADIARLYHQDLEGDRIEVLDSFPAHGSINAPRRETIIVRFSEPLDPSSLEGNIRLCYRNGGSCYATYVFPKLSSDSRIVTAAIPNFMSPLLPESFYELTVGSGVRSADGSRSMGVDQVISFQTGDDLVVGSYAVYDPDAVSSDTVRSSRVNNDRISTTSIDTVNAQDPVDLRSGDFVYENDLLRASGIGEWSGLGIYYRSRVSSEWILGHGWRVSYERFLLENPDGSVTYHDEHFGERTFYPTATEWEYKYLPAFKARLSKTVSGFGMMFDDGRSMAFDSAGKLTAILDRSGNATTFAYDTENRMISSTDPLGRIAEYVYRTDGQLSSVFARGQTISFVYHDGTGPGGMDGDLLSIRIGDGSEQDKTMLFTYPEVIPSNPLLSHNILTLTDSLGNTYVRNVYDEHDRVISQQYGDSTAQYEYAVADIYADGTTEPAIGQYVVQNRVTNGRGTVTEYTYDRIGNMLSRRVYASDGSGDSTETAYGYSEEGYLISETSTLGSGKKFAYDSRGNRTETRLKNDMAVPDGDDDIVERREYDPVNDRLLRRIAPDANVTDYSYDEFGRLTSVTKKSVRLDSDSEETSNLADTYEYDELGRLIRSMDAGGIETTVSYEWANPVSITRSKSGTGTTRMYTYDDRDNPVSVTDETGNTRTMEYDEFDRLIRATTAEWIQSEFEYDANGNVLAESPRSHDEETAASRRTIYDALDRPITVYQRISEDVEVATSTSYDANGNVASVTLPDGMGKTYVYDEFDRPILISVHPVGTADMLDTHYEYDENGNMVREIDTLGHATAYAYDWYGRLATVTDALGATREYSYDTLGNIVRSVARSASGTVLQDVRAEYNSVGNILVSSMADGEATLETRFAYDPAGRLLRRTDPTGAVTLYEYDDFGRLVLETDAEGTVSSTSYDARSLPVLRTVTGSGGKSVSAHAAYDGDGRLVRAWRTLAGEEYSTVYEYDARGNVTREIQPDGGETLREYDLAGRLLRETRTGSGVSSSTSYAYDIMGRPLSVTDPGDNVTRYEYDGYGRLAREILPDGATTEYTYDPLGRVATTRDPNGTVVTNTYDALGRLTRRDIAAGSGVLGVSYETYSYDGLGRLASAIDSLGQALSWSYDGYGRLSSEMQFGLSVGYSYDPAGRVSALSYPGGLSLATERDRVGRPLALTSPTAEYARYSYSGAELSGIAYPGGARADLAYDALSRLSSIAHSSATGGIIREDYGYDAEDKLLSDGWETYAYDGLDRLWRATDTVEYDAAKRQTTSRGGQYSYDSAGNREKLDRYAHVSRIVSVCKTVKVNGVNTRVCEDETRESESSYVLNSYESNALNQYDESVRHPDMTNRDETAYQYDANGSMTSDGTYLYGYDYRNRLVRITRVSDNRILKEITYDVLGRKTSWKSNSTTVRLIYAGDQVIEEYSRLHSNPFTLSTSYVWGERNSDDIVAMIRGEQTYYYHTDRLGSVLALTNSSGAVVERYSYDAYGVPSVWSDELGRYRSMGDSAVGNTLLYTGRPYDRIVGLYDMRARQYSAELGRFTSRDPIGMADDVNLYAYVGNSPLNYVDRFGREKALLMVVDKFNSYSSLFSREDATTWDLERVFSANWNPSQNMLYALTTFSAERGNLKVNPELRARAAWIDPNIQGPEAWKKIVLEWKDIWLADLGNLLYGFNWQKAGFTYEYIEAGAASVTDTANLAGANKPEWDDNESNDRFFYKAGYNLAQKKWPVTSEDLINTIGEVYRKNPEIYSSRIGW